MRALGQAGLPVPVAVDHNRHAVLMSLVDATLLVQVLPAAGAHAHLRTGVQEWMPCEPAREACPNISHERSTIGLH